MAGPTSNMMLLVLLSGLPNATPEPPTESSDAPVSTEIPTDAPTTTLTSTVVRWDPRWARVRAWEYIEISVFVAISPILAGIEGPEEPHWKGGFLFDDAIQDALTLSKRADRITLNKTADYLWYGNQLYPIVADAVLAAAVVHQDLDLAWQLFLMDIQAMTLTGFVSRLFHITLGRDRPLKKGCAHDRNYDPGCGSAANSFFSGHTAMAFTGAGLTCVHHKYLPLYGGGWADTLPCAVTITAASLTGLFRIMTGRHYTTDVLVGAAIGWASGYGLPYLLHYTAGDAPAPGNTSTALLPMVQNDAFGLTVMGSF